MKRTTVFLPDQLKLRIERVAREQRISEAELIRTAIDDYTRSGARPRPTVPLLDSVGPPDLADSLGRG